MLGIPATEQPIEIRYPRNSKFAAQLAGRFFVSGISGDYRKTRRKGAIGSSTLPDPAVPNAARQASRLRKEEQIRQDAQRMYELECKLHEVCHRNQIITSRSDLTRSIYSQTLLI